ncbi:TetR/AcrR family transcriptional regulator [Phytoactinopolyspora halotolerans]|uniref:TetR/AcrR family transcriptional regulator n=1 Tax=Phytoactinopolyspora halotolerans TaxID=1981512 RepID=A0A6L9S756_9ACTN|nr:TetR/AcrR family transcriptional regulator [Phytoactinopolyspora halotolerans]
MTAPRKAGMRADASRNRERIVEAAREVIGEFGPDVPLDTIAHRAGVGNATVYRHFDNRAELLRQVVLHTMTRVAERAEVALDADGDPFEALRAFIYDAAEEGPSALCSMIMEDFDKSAPDFVAIRRRVEDAINALMERARRSGQLRPDVALGDLMVAIAQLSRPLAGTGCDFVERYARRHLQLFVDGLHNPARSVLPGVPVTMEDLERRNT